MACSVPIPRKSVPPYFATAATASPPPADIIGMCPRSFDPKVQACRDPSCAALAGSSEGGPGGGVGGAAAGRSPAASQANGVGAWSPPSSKPRPRQPGCAPGSGFAFHSKHADRVGRNRPLIPASSKASFAATSPKVRASVDPALWDAPFPGSSLADQQDQQLAVFQAAASQRPGFEDRISVRQRRGDRRRPHQLRQ